MIGSPEITLHNVGASFAVHGAATRAKRLRGLVHSLRRGHAIVPMCERVERALQDDAVLAGEVVDRVHFHPDCHGSIEGGGKFPANVGARCRPSLQRANIVSGERRHLVILPEALGRPLSP